MSLHHTAPTSISFRKPAFRLVLPVTRRAGAGQFTPPDRQGTEQELDEMRHNFEAMKMDMGQKVPHKAAVGGRWFF